MYNKTKVDEPSQRRNQIHPLIKFLQFGQIHNYFFQASKYFVWRTPIAELHLPTVTKARCADPATYRGFIALYYKIDIAMKPLWNNLSTGSKLEVTIKPLPIFIHPQRKALQTRNTRIVATPIRSPLNNNFVSSSSLHNSTSLSCLRHHILQTGEQKSRDCYLPSSLGF